MKKVGFTIIELLVTLVIIGLLVSIASTNYLTAQKKARDNVRKAQVNTISVAIENYYSANKKFPGKINTAINPPSPLTVNSYNALYQNCETIMGSSGSFVYYYFPLNASYVGPLDVNQTPCGYRPATSGLYNPADYKPFPAWIPGLSSYLSPFPIDSRYQGWAGSTDPLDTNAGSYTGTNLVNVNDLVHADDSNANAPKTRTYVYRKLSGGYAVYTHLETAILDTDAVTSPSSITDNPAMPAEASLVDGKYIYMVRK